MSVLKKFRPYLLLMRIDKPIGTWLLLWPTLCALWLAGHGAPDIKIVMIFVLGVMVMRAAGCVANDIADRKLDPFVERTKSRPLASGQLTTKQALGLLIFLMLLAFTLVSFLNLKTILLSMIAAVLAMIYPFMKRITHFPQVVLGAAFSFSIPMAYAALQQALSFDVLWLYLTFLVWTVIYDTQYAMADINDDLKIGVKSTAIIFGGYDKKILALLQVLMLTSFWCYGNVHQFSHYFNLAILLTAGLFAYQQWLMKDRDPKLCFKAFLNHQYVGLLIFVGLLLGTLSY